LGSQKLVEVTELNRTFSEFRENVKTARNRCALNSEHALMRLSSMKTMNFLNIIIVSQAKSNGIESRMMISNPCCGSFARSTTCLGYAQREREREREREN
jgi:hypothetical protein